MKVPMNLNGDTEQPVELPRVNHLFDEIKFSYPSFSFKAGYVDFEISSLDIHSIACWMLTAIKFNPGPLYLPLYNKEQRSSPDSWVVFELEKNTRALRITTATDYMAVRDPIGLSQLMGVFIKEALQIDFPFDCQWQEFAAEESLENEPTQHILFIEKTGCSILFRKDKPIYMRGLGLKTSLTFMSGVIVPTWYKLAVAVDGVSLTDFESFVAAYRKGDMHVRG